MNYFARIIKHYIMLALEGHPIRIDSDTHAELDAAFVELDQHIKDRVLELIELHERHKAEEAR
jgi:hypothetical protein